MEIVSRGEAIEKGLPRFFTGEPCVNGHLSERNTKGQYCMVCNRKHVKKWREKTGYKTNPDYLKKWKADNKEKFKEYDGRRSKSWLAERAARRRSATPKWLTIEHKQQMKLIYQHARDCATVTGEMYEVDHVVPLKGRNVCGLHVPWNLQVLPKHINRSKRNEIMEY